MGGLRLRLLGATLGCALLATALTGLYLLKAQVDRSGRECRDRARATLVQAGKAARPGGAAAVRTARLILAANPDIKAFTLVPGQGGEELSILPLSAGDASATTLIQTPLAEGWLGRARVALPTLGRTLAEMSLELALIAAVVVGLFGVLLWPLLTSMVVMPLRQLTAHALAMAGGRGATRLREGGSSEMRGLAAAMNRLGAGLSERDRTSRANNMAVRYAFMQLRNVVDSLTEGEQSV